MKEGNRDLKTRLTIKNRGAKESIRLRTKPFSIRPKWICRTTGETSNICKSNKKKHLIQENNIKQKQTYKARSLNRTARTGETKSRCKKVERETQSTRTWGWLFCWREQSFRRLSQEGLALAPHLHQPCVVLCFSSTECTDFFSDTSPSFLFLWRIFSQQALQGEGRKGEQRGWFEKLWKDEMALYILQRRKDDIMD